MEYIKNDGLITKKFEVIINTERLQNIIKELDTRCFRETRKTIKVTAYNSVEARYKLQNETNSAGIKKYEILSVSDGYKDLVTYDGPIYMFDCEVLEKESSQLVVILNKLILNYNSKVDFKKENNHLIDLLYNYPNSEEIKSLELNQNEVNNPYFNPIYLLSLYSEAMSTINFVLLEEIKHNNIENIGAKVYKLKRK